MPERAAKLYRETAERRYAMTLEMMRHAERDGPQFAEIKDLVVKARIQLAQAKAALGQLRLPVQI